MLRWFPHSHHPGDRHATADRIFSCRYPYGRASFARDRLCSRRAPPPSTPPPLALVANAPPPPPRFIDFASLHPSSGLPTIGLEKERTRCRRLAASRPDHSTPPLSSEPGCGACV
uniref:Uncharacterized protein n=1 Tax=Plectus sambesii TaxID=2011161 RepID=A0A914WZA4_9BILA